MSRAFRPSLLVLLLIALQAVSTFQFNSWGRLGRRKREWIPPPKELTENVDYTQELFVAKIHSDYDDLKGNLYYSIEGVGVNKYPFNVFVVDSNNGDIRVKKILDREEIAHYNLTGVATFINGTEAENNIDIRFKVVDQNDNPPVFPTVVQPGSVKELSPTGTPVMKFAATDRDEPGNPNSQIKYSIVRQEPPGNMFRINQDGTITVTNPNLDRENTEQYTLVVKGEDLNGDPGGKTGTGTVVINLEDVNDNVPTLEKELYEGIIDENKQGMEVMRFKAQDLDATANNRDAIFDIVKGNEAGYFSIKTDPKTNEGILMLDKAVNYEDVKDLDLGIIVKNKAPPYGAGGSSGAGMGFGGGGGGGAGGGGAGGGGAGGGGAGGGGAGGGGAGGGTGGGTGGGGGGSWSSGSSWQSPGTYKTYPVKIKVKDEPEGPAFDPAVKAIPFSEGSTTFSTKTIIGQYQAIDQDTGKPAKNVQYIKGSDPDNWLYIDPITSEIKLNKKPDRESKFLVNGTYYAKVLCVTDDMPSKTATGTVAIQVEDFNDHCPEITSEHRTMCTNKDAVIVTAKDEDSYPNGAPFQFSILKEGTEGKWQVEHLNDTSAILRAQETMWPGTFKVKFLIKDEQGVACPEPQQVEVVVCTCEDGVMCGKRGGNGKPAKDISLGPAGIGLLLLGLLLLLLIPLLLLLCLCGGAGAAGKFAEMPFDSKAHLVNYRTEGQGENTEVPLLNMPMQHDESMSHVGLGAANRTMGAMNYQKSVASMDSGMMNGGGYQVDSYRRDTALGAMNTFGGAMNQSQANGFYSEFGNQESGGGGSSVYDGMALPHDILGQYYTQKLGSGNDNGIKDNFLVYDYEGQGSPAGSVGCCSLLESDNDLRFLDDLGPKFKTLAEVCGGKPIPSAPAPRPISHSFASNVSSTLPLPSPPKQAVSTKETVVKEVNERSQAVKQSTAKVREGTATMKTGTTNQGQMFLVQQQQPVYYATTPMVQPVQYVVQPQVSTNMMFTKAPATNLQSMVLVNGAQPAPTQGMVLVNGPQTSAAQGMVLVNGGQTGLAQGMVMQGPSVMSVGQAKGSGMMLVNGSGLRGNGGNIIQAGNMSGSQTMMVVEGKAPSAGAQTMMLVEGKAPSAGAQTMMLVEGKAPSAGAQTMMVVEGQAPTGSLKVIRGNQANIVQGGSLNPTGVYGSQRMMVVEGSAGGGGMLVQNSGGSSHKYRASGPQRNKSTNMDSSGTTKTTTVVKETFTEL